MYSRRSILPGHHHNTWGESCLSYYLVSENADLPPVIAGWLKLNYAVNKGKEGVVPADTHIGTGMNTCTPLSDQNSPGFYLLPGISLYSESLGLAVTTQMA